MLERPFTEEHNTSEEGVTSHNQEPEYVFEGFTVEFSEKIMLIPVAVSRSARKEGQIVR